MNIEKKLRCSNCKSSIEEADVLVNTDIRLKWNEEENIYEIRATFFDLCEVDFFICPKCFHEVRAETDDQDEN